MNRLIVIIFAILCSTFLYAQQDPTLTLIDNGVVIPGQDPWNGEACLFLGYPSQPASIQGICLAASDMQSTPANLTVTATSSNPLVLPIHINNINLNYDPSNGNTKLFLNPISDGETTVTVSVTDEDWNKSNYYIKITVKPCKDILCISMNDIDALPHGMTQEFFASDHIKTELALNAPIIRSNDDIEFIAGNFVQINAGFQVRPGGEFLMDIEDCN